MKVRTLIDLLTLLPDHARDILVQDSDGNAILDITGIWIDPDTDAPLQITTVES